MKEVCVVICNFNKKEFVVNAIDSVKKYSDDIADIIVVDNCSTDGSVDFIKSRCSDIEVVSTSENIGGSGGFSLGMQMAYLRGYDKIALLDNDAAVTDKCLQVMSSILNDHAIGVVGPAICKMNSPSVIQEIGANIDIKECIFKLRHAGEKFEDVSKSDDVHDVSYVPACCLMTTNKVIGKVGFFNLDYFLYWDDIDWCTRVKLNGYRVVATSSVKALHMGGGATSKSLTPRYYYWRNKFHYFKTYSSMFGLNTVKESLRAYIIKNLFFQNINGMGELIAPLLRAIDDISDSKLGRLNACFQERRNGKSDVIKTCIPPGEYNVVIGKDILDDFEKKLRVISILSSFDFSLYKFFIRCEKSEFDKISLPDELIFCNVSSIVKTLDIMSHLSELDVSGISSEVIYTDLLLNVLPEKVESISMLAFYQQVIKVDKFIDLYFCEK